MSGLIYVCCILVLVYTQQKAEERGTLRTVLCYLAPLCLAISESFEAADDATEDPQPARLAPVLSIAFESLLYATLICGTMLSIFDGSTRKGCHPRAILTLVSLSVSFIFFAIAVIINFKDSEEAAIWWFVPTDLLLFAVPLINVFFSSELTPLGQGSSEKLEQDSAKGGLMGTNKQFARLV